MSTCGAQLTVGWGDRRRPVGGDVSCEFAAGHRGHHSWDYVRTGATTTAGESSDRDAELARALAWGHEDTVWTPEGKVCVSCGGTEPEVMALGYDKGGTFAVALHRSCLARLATMRAASPV